jgi:hypothetical protein
MMADDARNRPAYHFQSSMRDDALRLWFVPLMVAHFHPEAAN